MGAGVSRRQEHWLSICYLILCTSYVICLTLRNFNFNIIRVRLFIYLISSIWNIKRKMQKKCFSRRPWLIKTCSWLLRLWIRHFNVLVAWWHTNFYSLIYLSNKFLFIIGLNNGTCAFEGGFKTKTLFSVWF